MELGGLNRGSVWRLSTIAERAWLVLVSTTAVCAVAAAVFGTGGFLAASSVALGVLLGLKGYHMISDKIPAKLKLAMDTVIATAGSIIGALVLGASIPFGFLMKEPSNKGDDEPILLVHGYLGHRTNWWYLRYRLKQAGHQQVYTLNLGYPFHSIEHFARKVDTKVKKIQKKTGSSSVKLIGHSMGGVISAYYSTHIAKGKTVSQVITLGSPLKGTRVGLIGIGKCTNQMKYQSAFTKTLAEKINSCQKKFWHFAAENDLIVRPVSSALMDQERSTLFSRLGHIGLLFSDRVADELIKVSIR